MIRMKLPRLFRAKQLVYVVVLLAIVLRTWFIEADLPLVHDPDEPVFVDRAMAMLRNRDPNPHWFGAPASPTIYMLAGIYGGLFVLGRLSGHFNSPEDFRVLYHTDPTLIYLSGRLATSLFGIGCVILTYAIGNRLQSHWCGLVAALLVAINREHVIYSQLIRMDVLMGFFLL